MFVWVCGGECVYTWCACRGQRSLSGVLLNHSPPEFWRQGSHCTWGSLVWLDWLPESFRDLPVSAGECHLYSKHLSNWAISQVWVPILILFICMCVCMWWAQKCTLCGGYWMWRRGWCHVTFHIIYRSSFSLNFKFASSVSLVSQIALEIHCLVPGITGRLLLCLSFVCVGDRSGELWSSLLYDRDPLNNVPRLFSFKFMYMYVCVPLKVYLQHMCPVPSEIRRHQIL